MENILRLNFYFLLLNYTFSSMAAGPRSIQTINQKDEMKFYFAKVYEDVRKVAFKK